MTDMQAEAFDAIYREYNGLLYGFAYTILHSRALAEDVVQDAFVRALSSLDLTREKGAVRAWLFTTVRNLSIDCLRRESRSAGEEPLFVIASSEGERMEQMVFLNELMAALEETEQRMLMLSASGFRQREIAGMLNLPLGTVSWRMHRLHKKIDSLRGDTKGEGQ
ncbi:MAG: RNA polymerase sigma factor [Clostridia bacterium]|nr:RNA polymerase sigma factor [Clostridia bacterium]